MASKPMARSHQASTTAAGLGTSWSSYSSRRRSLLPAPPPLSLSPPLLVESPLPWAPAALSHNTAAWARFVACRHLAVTAGGNSSSHSLRCGTRPCGYNPLAGKLVTAVVVPSEDMTPSARSPCWVVRAATGTMICHRCRHSFALLLSGQMPTSGLVQGCGGSRGAAHVT